jgi:hypothetical protein
MPWVRFADPALAGLVGSFTQITSRETHTDKPRPDLAMTILAIVPCGIGFVRAILDRGPGVVGSFRDSGTGRSRGFVRVDLVTSAIGQQGHETIWPWRVYRASPPELGSFARFLTDVPASWVRFVEPRRPMSWVRSVDFVTRKIDHRASETILS